MPLTTRRHTAPRRTEARGCLPLSTLAQLLLMSGPNNTRNLRSATTAVSRAARSAAALLPYDPCHQLFGRVLDLPCTK